MRSRLFFRASAAAEMIKYEGPDSLSVIHRRVISSLFYYYVSANARTKIIRVFSVEVLTYALVR